jgi:hypothetical protein
MHAPSEEEDAGAGNNHTKVIEKYKQYFTFKRKEQTNAAEQILAKTEYAYRYELTRKLVDEIFKTLRKAQRHLEAVVDLRRSDALQEDIVLNVTTFDAAVSVWENTAFLGDLLLRLPNMVHQMIDGHLVRTQLVVWAVEASKASGVFVSPHHLQLDLILQELRLAAEIDPLYVNPFSEDELKKKEAAMLEERKKRKAKEQEQRRKEARRPRLSDPRDDL